MAHEIIPYGNRGESSFNLWRWVNLLTGPRQVVAERMEPDLDRIHAATEPQITWIGHACFLVQFAGQNLLIDPVFSKRLGWLKQRHVTPGLRVEQLPQIDAILLTGKHRDAFDRGSLLQLPRTAMVFVPRGAGPAVLRLEFNRVIELKRWEPVAVGDTSIMQTPANGKIAWRTMPAGGFIIDAAGASLYLSGPATEVDLARTAMRRPRITAAVIHQFDSPTWLEDCVEFRSPVSAVPFADSATRIVPSGWGTYVRRSLGKARRIEERSVRISRAGEQWTIPRIGETIPLTR